MASLDEACEQVVQHVNGAVACGVVDLDSGFLVAVCDKPRWGAEVHDALASMTTELFRGKRTGEVERVLRAKRGQQPELENHFTEVQLTSSNHLHFAVMLPDGRTALLLVTERTTNVGMGWAQLKSALANLQNITL